MSDRIAVMNGGSVEQVGSPREIYERPATAFVADFIGSLNALDVTVDEVVGGYAVARLGERDRVVAPVDASVRPGAGIRVAVRPEWVRIGVETGDGSHLGGTVAEVVYLGMYTQFHVDTPAGRIVSHRLAEDAPQLAVGEPVSIFWDADQSYELAELAAVPV